MAGNYTLRIDPRVARQLQRMPKNIRTHITERIGELAANPMPPGYEVLKSATQGGARATFGDYRILYVIDKKSKIVWVEGVGARADVYKLMKYVVTRAASAAAPRT